MQTTLKCILLDDELPGLAYLRMLCEQMEGVEVVKAFNDPRKLVKELPSLDFQVCVLDIEMPGMNGLEVAKLLKGKSIIFATAYKEYAAEAFDLEAVDYIRKPIQADRLEKAFQKVRNFQESQKPDNHFAELNSNKGKLLLRFADICYISTADSDRRDKKVLLKDKQEIILKNVSFEQLLQLMPEDLFCRINRQVILALDTVKVYTHDQITTTLTNEFGTAISFPLNEQYRPHFRSLIKF